MKKHLLLCFSIITIIAQAQDRGFITPKGTERRIALVIGNSTYSNVAKLKNTLNDANDMELALQKLDFEVIKVLNTDRFTMSQSINRFRDKLTSADVAFFYFAGHGVSYSNKNYLLPTDFDANCLEQIEDYGVALSRLLGDISAKNVKNSFVVLDACRNIPDLRACDVNKRELGDNTALVRPTNNPMGSMVVYATEEGSKAEDRSPNGRNGLFTGALLKYLTTPDLTLRSIIDQTSLEVLKQSDGKQTPARYDKIYGDFYFIKSVTPIQVSEEVKKVDSRQIIPTKISSTPATNEVEKETPKTTPTFINGVSTKKFMDIPFAEMVYVQGGTFEMGDTRNEGFNFEKPVHSVTVSDFWMGKYEVTQVQWESIMGSNPSHFKDCPTCPVDQVGWEDIQEFLKRLNAKTGSNYRLPTEAEWEYAAGGGNQVKRSRLGNGAEILRPSEANFYGVEIYKEVYSEAGESKHCTIAVGSLGHPNFLGIHDMAGNVMEWCSDWYEYYTSSPSNNPMGASNGEYRVIRGGGWKYFPNYCRVAFRYKAPPSFRDNSIGFRVVSSM